MLYPTKTAMARLIPIALITTVTRIFCFFAAKELFKAISQTKGPEEVSKETTFLLKVWLLRPNLNAITGSNDLIELVDFSATRNEDPMITIKVMISDSGSKGCSHDIYAMDLNATSRGEIIR